MIKNAFKAAIVAATLSTNTFAADITMRGLHRYAANHTAWNTNSFWIEGENGIALIDAQLLVSDTKALAAQIKATGKPLAGVIVTHPHFDHFGGLPVLKDIFGDFPIYATQATADHFEGTHKQIIGGYKMPNAFGEALDERLAMPTHMVENGDTVSIAGINFKIHDLGAGEAANNIIVEQADLKVLFAGDVFYPHTHYYVGEGNVTGALSHLRYVQDNFPADMYVYAGHNDPTRVSSASVQIGYIETFIELVSSARQGASNIAENGRLTAPARKAIVDQMLKLYPAYDDFSFGAATILNWNSYGIEAELLRNAN
jgi:glyoxylase-like metal-dependent hydrolase (beta-lactamase superfamily II)